MKTTYIHHSSFFIEMNQVCLLFDYVGGPLPKPVPEKPLLVFASHRHGDHFSPEIFDLAKAYPKIRFILSDDIWQNRVPLEMGCHTEFIDPGKILQLPEGAGVKITAFHSTDEGVAFVVETEGMTLYHAGDLNNWCWNGESLAWNNNMSANYKRELEKIKETFPHINAAFIPLDGRQEDLFYLGLDDFMQLVGADVVFPMHFWEDYSVIPRLKELDCAKAYGHKVMTISKEGQEFS